MCSLFTVTGSTFAVPTTPATPGGTRSQGFLSWVHAEDVGYRGEAERSPGGPGEESVNIPYSSPLIWKFLKSLLAAFLNI